MDAVKQHFGSSCMVHLEDLNFNHSVKFLSQYRGVSPIFIDEIQGTLPFPPSAPQNSAGGPGAGAVPRLTHPGGPARAAQGQPGGGAGRGSGTAAAAAGGGRSGAERSGAGGARCSGGLCPPAGKGKRRGWANDRPTRWTRWSNSLRKGAGTTGFRRRWQP